MYHVSNKTRVIKSAQAICDGLEQCLLEKPLKKITVNDIYQHCYVSRATFYRLFDSIVDVLAYECNRIFEERIKAFEDNSFTSKKERALYSIKIWLSHPQLIKAIINNNLSNILYETHSRHSQALMTIYNVDFDNEEKADYFLSMLSSLICGSLTIYFRHGGNEPIEEVYSTVCECASVISETFNSDNK